MSQENENEIRKLVKGDELLEMMYEERKRMSDSESLMLEFDKEVEDERERRLIEKTIKLEGKEEGTKLGMEQEKIKTAKNLLALQVPINIIAKATGLSKKVINTLM